MSIGLCYNRNGKQQSEVIGIGTTYDSVNVYHDISTTLVNL